MIKPKLKQIGEEYLETIIQLTCIILKQMPNNQSSPWAIVKSTENAYFQERGWWKIQISWHSEDGQRIRAIKEFELSDIIPLRLEPSRLISEAKSFLERNLHHYINAEVLQLNQEIQAIASINSRVLNQICANCKTCKGLSQPGLEIIRNKDTWNQKLFWNQFNMKKSLIYSYGDLEINQNNFLEIGVCESFAHLNDLISQSMPD